MIKAVIFDLDGLIIDSEKVSYQIYHDLLAQYHHAFTQQEYALNYSGKTEIVNVKQIIQNYQLPLSFEQAYQYCIEQDNIAVSQGIPLKEGVKELLEYLNLHHYQIGLATSSTTNRCNSILAFHHLDQYFQQIVYGNDVTHGKPHPDIFLKAIKQLGLDSNECLVLEDSEAGIEAGYRAGCQVINIPDLKKPQPIFLTYCQASYTSLLEVITYLNKNKKMG